VCDHNLNNKLSVALFRSEIDEGLVRVAITLFSIDPRTEISLNNNHNYNELAGEKKIKLLIFQQSRIKISKIV